MILNWFPQGGFFSLLQHSRGAQALLELQYRRAPLELVGTADKHQLLLQVGCATAVFGMSNLFVWKPSKQL